MDASDAWAALATSAEVEERIQRSVFLARAEPCRSEEEARAALGRVQAAHRDATHVCWAYVLGADRERRHCSDAGEPSGTAGRPILGAIERSGATDALVTVVRWFGGVKLGPRGLIEAYGGVAARALAAAGTVLRARTRRFSVEMPWPSVGAVERVLDAHGATGVEREHAEMASVSADVPLSRAEACARALEELAARGKVAGWSMDEGGRA